MATEAQIQGAEPLQASSTKESEITLSIKSLQEETLQISELTEMEKAYAVEVISFLKQIIEPLNVSFHIKPASVTKADSSLQDVVLTPQGTVCLIYNSGTISSKPLESLQTETMVKILMEVIPEIKALLVDKRQKINGRVGMLEKVAREFRKVGLLPKSRPAQGAAAPYQAPMKSAGPSQDAMKSAIGGQ